MNEHDWFQTRFAIRLPDGALAKTPNGIEWTTGDRQIVEKAMAYYREGAERLGVEEWNGQVVRQLCTPWIGEDDNADLMIKELSDWLTRQTGAGS